jgi:glycosyltransferase involved in cell wall biosynthesis
MRYTSTPVRLVLAGQADNPSVRQEIFDLIDKYDLHGRVEFLDEWITEDRKQALFADCLACIYIPLDEDSYGYPTLEAFHCEKPVITTVDAGGTLEIVQSGRNGFVTLPLPEAIARMMDTLYRDRERACQMGLAGKRRLDELGIGWDHVVEKLTR